MHQEEEASDIHSDTGPLSISLTHVFRREILYLRTKQRLDSEDRTAGHDKVHHLVLHHETFHLLRKEKNVVRASSRVFDLLFKVRLVVCMYVVNLCHTEWRDQLVLRRTRHYCSHI